MESVTKHTLLMNFFDVIFIAVEKYNLRKSQTDNDNGGRDGEGDNRTIKRLISEHIV